MSERQHVAAATGIFLLLALLLPSAAGAEVVQTTAPAPADTAETPDFQGDRVVVTASRYDTDVHLTHTNLTREDLRRTLTAVDVPMLLQDIPGLYAYSDAGNGLGYSYLKIRGFDQRRVAVLVNGIPLNDPESHEVYWVDLPDLLASVEDVQVQRGITNGVSGVTAIGGAVNLVTAVLQDEPEGRATVETGSFGTNRRMISYQTGDLGGGVASLLRLSQVESDGYRDRTGSEQWAVFWSGRWQNPNHRVQANAYTGKELTQHGWNAAAESDLRRNRRHNPETYWNAVDDFRQPHYELHWDWQLTEHLSLRNTAYHIMGEGFYENFKADEDVATYSLDVFFPDRYAADDAADLVRQKWVRKHQSGWVPSLTWTHAGGRLVVGGDWYTFHSKHWGDVLAAGPGSGGQSLTPDDITGGQKYHDFTGEKDAWSAYLNDRWEFLPGLTLMTDLQWQHRQYDFLQQEVGSFNGAERNAYAVEYDFFNPKAGLFYEVPGQVAGGQLGVYGHVGANHREPADSDYWGVWAGPDDLGQDPLFDRSELVYEDGEVAYTRWSGPQIQEERVLNYEAGVAFHDQRISVTFNGYYMDFEDEIVDTGLWDDDNQRTVRANAERTIHKGLELGLRWAPHHRHAVAVAASRSWDTYEAFRYEFAGQQVDHGGNPIALFPEALASATWEADLGTLTSRLRVRHVGRQYLDPTGDPERSIDPSTVVDLALFADAARLGLVDLAGVEGFVRVHNLFDEQYETWGYHDVWAGENFYIPGAPRSYMAGVNYRF